MAKEDKKITTKDQLNNFKISMKTQESLLKLFDKYKDNTAVTKKIENYVVKQLPQMIENSEAEYKKKMQREKKISRDKSIFVYKFLNNNKYCYIPTTGIFIEYNKIKFVTSKEDDIQHKILTKVTNDSNLLQWKYQVKTTILKEIKSRTLFKIIPESITIQNVLETLFPTIFKSKEWTKYFLCVIGDNILKKNNNLIHFMCPAFKVILNSISNECSNYFSSSFNPTESIKLKFHDHSHEKCRIIDINDNITTKTYDECINNIKGNILDLISVSTYYSERYGSSDNYIKTTLLNTEIYDRVFYLCITPIANQIESFMCKYITNTNIKGKRITWDEILFLWKYHLKQNNLPNIIFHNSLKELLTKNLNFNAEKDCFENCFSMFIDRVSLFNKFWSQTIKSKKNEELETDEVYDLFKLWYKKQKKDPSLGNNMSILSDINIVDVISHFNKGITITNNKYLLNVKCELWDKTGNIKDSLLKMKEENKKNKSETPVPLDNAYKSYCKMFKKQKGLICNKTYFEKKVPTLIDVKHIDDNLILPSYWE